MVGIGAVVGKETGVEQIPDTPEEDVVGERVGLPCWTDGSYDTCILSIAGHSHQGFSETERGYIILSCPAVDGDEERHLSRVVDGTKIADLDEGLIPFLIPAVVTMLHDVGALVKGSDDVFCCGTCPSAKFTWGGRDVPQTIGAEIRHDVAGAAGRRPLVTQFAAVYLAEACWCLSVLAEVTIDG